MDQFSRLPEEVIIHILSLLPTKYAATTSVLSKQWSNRWTHVTNIDLDNRLFITDSSIFIMDRLWESMPIFTKFVNKLLLSPYSNVDQAPIIQTFTLNVSSSRGFINMKSWIESALKRGVIDLKIKCDHIFSRDLPTDFSSNKLCILRISNFVPKLSLLPRFNLPCLVYLRLNILNPSSETMENLFRHECFPVLKELILDLNQSVFLAGSTYYCIRIISPTLNRLTVNVRGFSNHKIVIDTPSLNYLSFEDDNFLCMIEAAEKMEELKKAYTNIKFNQQFPFERLKEHPPLPNFDSVRSIQIYSSSDTCYKMMLIYLRWLPHLKKIKIYLSDMHYNLHIKVLEPTKILSSLLGLEKVKLLNFCGCVEDIDLVSNIALYARSITKLMIYFCPMSQKEEEIVEMQIIELSWKFEHHFELVLVLSGARKIYTYGGTSIY